MSEPQTQTYPEPPAVGSEVDTLIGSLERQRATFRWKCADLDEAGLRTKVAASQLTLGSLLKHLAYMEDINFTRELAGAELPVPWSEVEPEGRSRWVFESAERDSPAVLYDVWTSAVERSRIAIADAAARGGGAFEFAVAGYGTCTLRRLLVDLIEEYGRHTGQADLIREAVDGRVGEDPPGQPTPYRC